MDAESVSDSCSLPMTHRHLSIAVGLAFLALVGGAISAYSLWNSFQPMSTAQRLFYTHEKALNQFVIDLRTGVIPEKQRGGYEISSLPNGAFDAAFTSYGHLVIAKYGITPDDSVSFLVYCPDGGQDEYIAAFNRGGGISKVKEVVRLSKHWLFVLIY